MSALKVGDNVCVHGWGYGIVKKLGEDHFGDPLVTVEDKRDCRCDCGNRHTHKRRTVAHLRHVSLSGGSALAEPAA